MVNVVTSLSIPIGTILCERERSCVVGAAFEWVTIRVLNIIFLQSRIIRDCSNFWIRVSRRSRFIRSPNICFNSRTSYVVVALQYRIQSDIRVFNKCRILFFEVKKSARKLKNNFFTSFLRIEFVLYGQKSLNFRSVFTADCAYKCVCFSHRQVGYTKNTQVGIVWTKGW